MQIANVEINKILNIKTIFFRFPNLFVGIRKNRKIKKKYDGLVNASNDIKMNKKQISLKLISFFLSLKEKLRKIAITKNESAMVRLSAEREAP